MELYHLQQTYTHISFHSFFFTYIKVRMYAEVSHLSSTRNHRQTFPENNLRRAGSRADSRSNRVSDEYQDLLAVKKLRSELFDYFDVFVFPINLIRGGKSFPNSASSSTILIRWQGKIFQTFAGACFSYVRICCFILFEITVNRVFLEFLDCRVGQTRILKMSAWDSRKFKRFSFDILWTKWLIGSSGRKTGRLTDDENDCDGSFSPFHTRLMDSL